MADTIEFHGTETEKYELQEALGHFCSCTYWEHGGTVRERCAGHRDIVANRYWVDHLLALRRVRPRLNRQEWLGHRVPEVYP